MKSFWSFLCVLDFKGIFVREVLPCPFVPDQSTNYSFDTSSTHLSSLFSFFRFARAQAFIFSYFLSGFLATSPRKRFSPRASRAVARKLHRCKAEFHLERAARHTEADEPQEKASKCRGCVISIRTCADPPPRAFNLFRIPYYFSSNGRTRTGGQS